MQDRAVLVKRFQETSTPTNSSMTRRLLEIFEQPSSASKKLLENAMAKLGLSVRAYDRILKFARAITDLEGTEVIDTSHVSEATQSQNLDRPL